MTQRGTTRRLRTDADTGDYREGEIPLYVHNKVYDAVTLANSMYSAVYYTWGDTHEYTTEAYKLYQNMLYWMRCRKVAVILRYTADNRDVCEDLAMNMGYASAIGDDITQLCCLMVRLFAFDNDCEIPNVVSVRVVKHALKNFLIRAMVKALAARLEEYRIDSEYVFNATGYSYSIRA